MDVNTLDKSIITDIAIKDRLLNKKNIELLEHIIDKDSRELKSISGYIENDLVHKDLKTLYPKIVHDINAFLDVNLSAPKCNYFSMLKLTPDSALVYGTLANVGVALYSTMHALKVDIDLNTLFIQASITAFSIGLVFYTFKKSNNTYYSSLFNNILVEKGVNPELLPAMLGHEYTHYVQNKSLLMNYGFSNTMFCEGHARGVQKYLTQKYFAEEGYLESYRLTLDMTLSESKSVYMWMCDKLELAPNKEFSKDMNKEPIKKPNKHSFGSTYFSICETLHGNKIYSEAVKGNLGFMI